MREDDFHVSEGIQQIEDALGRMQASERKIIRRFGRFGRFAVVQTGKGPERRHELGRDTQPVVDSLAKVVPVAIDCNRTLQHRRNLSANDRTFGPDVDIRTQTPDRVRNSELPAQRAREMTGRERPEREDVIVLVLRAEFLTQLAPVAEETHYTQPGHGRDQVP